MLGSRGTGETMTKRTSPMIAALLALSLALGGCGFFQPAPAAEESPTDEVVVTDGEAPRESQTIQVGEGSHTVRMTNDSGCAITALRVKDAATEEFPAELTYEGLEVLPGDVIELSFDPIAGAQAYEVRLTTDEEQTIVLRALDLAGIAELSVLYEGGIGYVTYVDEETQQEVDTHDSAVQAQQEEDESMVTHDMETQLDPEE